MKGGVKVWKHDLDWRQSLAKTVSQPTLTIEDRRHGHRDALVRRLPVCAGVSNASAGSCVACPG